MMLGVGKPSIRLSDSNASHTIYSSVVAASWKVVIKGIIANSIKIYSYSTNEVV